VPIALSSYREDISAADTRTTMTTIPTTRCAFAVLAIAALPLVAGAQTFPKTLTANAEASSSGGGRLTGTITIQVDRLMEELDFKKVSDALKVNGYLRFLPVLRTLPPVGYVQLGETRTVLKFAHMRANGKTLVLGSDRPIFFIGGGAPEARPKAGYEMGVIELDLDAQGNGTGTMAAAARVKHTTDGGVAIDDYADKPVKLAVKPAK
jgi:hypothetical protein